MILGLGLALFVSLATYFNDWVIVQTHLVGNHLPIGVFGVLILLLLLVNPLLGLIGKRFKLGAGELAIMTALGLMAAVWAGSSFNRTFFTNMVYPAYDLRAKSAWHSAKVMSYLPGGSAEIADGHVTSWTDLLAVLNRAATDPQSTLEGIVADGLTDEDRLLIEQAVNADRLEHPTRRRLLEIVNRTLIGPTSSMSRPPPHTATIESTPTMEAALAKRDRAREAVEALRVQADAAQAALADKRSQLSAAMTPLEQREAEATERIEALNRRIGDEPDNQQLLDELQGLERQRQTARAELAVYKDELAPLIRTVQRLGWRIDYYRSYAERQERRANRAAAVALADGLFLPAPRGEGVFLNDGFMDPFVSETLIQGWDGDRPLGWRDLGWWTWWPTIRTWGLVAVLLTLGLLCLSIIVHPQWSRRELLTYPIVRFVEAVTEPGRGALPRVMSSKLFWIGFLMVLFIHGWNGLDTWYPGYLLPIPLRIDMVSARSLFADMSKAPYSWSLWNPVMYPSLIGFAYFLNKEISLSVGLAMPTWVFFAGSLVASGVAIENGLYASQMMPLFRFGAYLGLSAILLYIGRRYYTNVAISAFGLRRNKETPAYATWAMRALLVCLVGAGWALNQYVGMDWLLAVLFIGVVLVMSLGMARISAETGAFFIKPHFMPVGVITAFLGIGSIGPEAYFALAIASAVMMNDPRESAMPFFVNALNMGDRVAKAGPAKTGIPLGLVLVIAFCVAGASTLYWQYAEGAGATDSFARNVASESPNRVEQQITHLQARGELTKSNTFEGLGRLGAIQPNWQTMGWVAGGIAMVVLFSVLRLRLSWWPLHPVMFLLWGTFPLVHLWFSFLLGWLIKITVTKFGGAKGYHAAIPLMVGLVAGELLAAFGWALIGGAYFFVTGNTPTTIRILPG